MPSKSSNTHRVFTVFPNRRSNSTPSPSQEQTITNPQQDSIEKTVSPMTHDPLFAEEPTGSLVDIDINNP
ncbi:hypothetical protein WN55_01262 [Dufourea novaeangliae]|uniref:Uncharacterized protein n=1 Tax=Dufourea novaeangliae TaxID=178035 RepID=A0A154NWN6_DUFNO|nr:hypothetical protein WN55_01262 [Dufourea novaeangliae]